MHEQEVDTNVVSISLGILKEEGMVATGDPIICMKCGAILNLRSKIDSSESEQIWACEFCSNKNVINVDEEEIPTAEGVTYVLESAQQGLSLHFSLHFS